MKKASPKQKLSKKAKTAGKVAKSQPKKAKHSKA